MTSRTWMWRGRFVVWFAVLSLPLVALLIPINVVESDFRERLIGNIVLIASFLLVAVMHTWISVRPDKLRFGFFPLYWKTLKAKEVRYAIRVEFQPFRDFAGLGLKGLAKSRNGILLGGNPSQGIMIETHDRRRYILSFVDPDSILRQLTTAGYVVSDVPLVDEVPAGSSSDSPSR